MARDVLSALIGAGDPHVMISPPSRDYPLWRRTLAALVGVQLHGGSRMSARPPIPPNPVSSNRQSRFADKMRDDEAYRKRIAKALNDNLDRSIIIGVDLRLGAVVRGIRSVRPIPDSARDFEAWVIDRSHIGVELVMEAEVDIDVEIHDRRARGGPAIAGLGSVNEEVPAESQTVHALISGQLELPDVESDEILAAYAYITRLSDTDFRLSAARRHRGQLARKAWR